MTHPNREKRAKYKRIAGRAWAEYERLERLEGLALAEYDRVALAHDAAIARAEGR